MFLDNVVAFRILQKLVTPFKDTEAFKLGIIDERGTLLKKSSEWKTSEEKDAMNVLNRLVFNLKRILGKLPGGESKIASLSAAYFLIKEHHDKDYEVSVEVLNDQMSELLEYDAVLVEEVLEITNFLKLYEEGGVGAGPAGGMVSTSPANVTGAAVSTDEPKIYPRKRKKKDDKTNQIGSVENKTFRSQSNPS